MLLYLFRVDAVMLTLSHQPLAMEAAEVNWENNDLVFATRTGTKLNAANVRREFRRVIAKAGLPAEDWTPREMRHSLVSLLSADVVPIEQISARGTRRRVTEKVYRQQIQPVIQEGAAAMDRIFPDPQDGEES